MGEVCRVQWKYCIPFFPFFMGDTVWIKPEGHFLKKKKKKKKKRSNLLEYSEEYFIQKSEIECNFSCS